MADQYQQPTVDTGNLIVAENRGQPPRESPLNSANQSRITICSDPPLFHADAYASPESETNTGTPQASSLNGGSDSRNLSSAGASRTRDPTLPNYTPDASAPVLSPGPCQPPVGISATQNAASPVKTLVPGLDVNEEEVLAIVDDNSKFLEKKDRDIEFLELTREQLTEMVSEEAGLTKDEYFDLNYLAQEAAKVWEERVVTDPETSITASRLFPKSSSPLRSTRHSAGGGSSDGVTPMTNLAAFEQKHPIMFRRMQRNKARRELFNESMQHHSQITGSDISTSTITIGDIRNKVQAQSPLQPQQQQVLGTTQSSASPTTVAQEKAKARKAALEKKKKLEEEEASRRNLEMTPQQEEIPAETATEETVTEINKQSEGAPKERTLAELLKEQQQQLATNEKRDAEIYKPLMASFNKYEENARAKLTALIEKCAAENEAAEEAARVEEERRIREQRALDEGLDL